MTDWLALCRAAVEDVRGGLLAGPLVISVIPSFAARWLVPRLKGFVDAYPDIDVTVRAELRSVDFAREDVDLGIRYGYQRFMPEMMLAVVVVLIVLVQAVQSIGDRLARHLNKRIRHA